MSFTPNLTITYRITQAISRIEQAPLSGSGALTVDRVDEVSMS